MSSYAYELAGHFAQRRRLGAASSIIIEHA
jgi:hypothetical protein